MLSSTYIWRRAQLENPSWTWFLGAHKLLFCNTDFIEDSIKAQASLSARYPYCSAFFFNRRRLSNAVAQGECGCLETIFIKKLRLEFTCPGIHSARAITSFMWSFSLFSSPEISAKIFLGSIAAQNRQMKNRTDEAQFSPLKWTTSPIFPLVLLSRSTTTCEEEF